MMYTTKEVMALIVQDNNLARVIIEMIDDAMKNDAAFKAAIMSAMSDLDAHICKVWDDRGSDGYGPDEQQWQDIPF